MFIRTTRPNLLIGDTCHPFGATVEVDDDLGHRFIRSKCAVPADLFDPPAPAPVEVETAEAPDPPESAALTTAARKRKG